MKAFIKNLSEGQVPKKTPDWIQRHENSSMLVKAVVHFGYREKVTKNFGMWGLVDLTWTEKLANWIGNRRVLEIMAGCGWLAKALNHHNVRITATDDFSWETTTINQVFEVQRYDAVEAVRSLGQEHDILLVSWSPSADESICRACEEWKSDRPIIYIGEGQGGANAPQQFFERFDAMTDAPDIEIPKWWFLHDRLIIGKYDQI